MFGVETERKRGSPPRVRGRVAERERGRESESRALHFSRSEKKTENGETERNRTRASSALFLLCCGSGCVSFLGFIVERERRERPLGVSATSKALFGGVGE